MKKLLYSTILGGLLVTSVTFNMTQSNAADVKTQTQTRTYSYDSNKDGYIQPDEFTTYLYTKSDTNADGYMGDEEWKVTTSQIYRPYKDLDYNSYTYWDQDKDKKLDNNEVKTLIEKTGLYSKWDLNTDGKISNEEFEKGTFNSYDDDGNGSISMTEWKTVLR